MTGGCFRLHPACLDANAQEELVSTVLGAAGGAPFYRPFTPGGQAMSVEMTNLGALGWVTDARGYRYEPAHPLTGRAWPAIPSQLVALWEAVAPGAPLPDACLVNLYRGEARMGLHQDRDEADFSIPVVSLSLGDTAIFRIGGRDRRAPTRSICVLAGEARLAFHGVDRILPGSSRLIPGGGRINLTLRRAR